LATEVQIRNAIAAKIAEVAPQAVVVPRNILNTKNNGWLGLLQSPDDNDRIHGWMVTQRAAPINEQRTNGAEYSLNFSVWQFWAYETGDDAANSEDASSSEREVVMTAFANAAALPSELSRCEGLEFSLIDLFWVGDRLVHIAQGTMTVNWVTNCS
jgi:uncharacterized protein (DUF3084 family)